MDRTDLTTPPPLSASPPQMPIAPTTAPATGPTSAPAIAPPPLPKEKPAAIAVSALTKRYGSLTALDALTLRLDAGDVFGFIGPNGAGKSTTMKILAGLLAPTSGSASVLGKNVVSNGEFIRR